MSCSLSPAATGDPRNAARGCEVSSQAGRNVHRRDGRHGEHRAGRASAIQDSTARSPVLSTAQVHRVASDSRPEPRHRLLLRQQARTAGQLARADGAQQRLVSPASR